jgi:hypothetical protein
MGYVVRVGKKRKGGNKMGRRIKISDLLKLKEPGDEWFTIEAPEEFHVWQKKAPWNPRSSMSRTL